MSAVESWDYANNCARSRPFATDEQTVRAARLSSMRRLRYYLASARGELPDNGQPASLKWNLVWLAASDFLAWKEWR